MSNEKEQKDIKQMEKNNIYLNKRKEWNEATGLWRANAVMWRMFAIASLILNFFAVGGMIYAAQLPDVVPMVYREDASGGLTLVGIPNKVLKPDNGAITNQLAAYITAVREVPLSEGLRSRNISIAKQFSSTQVWEANIAPMMLDEYKAVGMGEQLITFKSALPINNHIWQLEWKEYKNGKYTATFKANIDYTVSKGSFKNPDDRMHNPYGIVVKDMVVTQVLGS